MVFMSYFIIFLIGASVGSFLNVLIYRLPKREKIIFSRSACPTCSHKLSFFDLIPIFSFLFLGGRCRYCRTKISYHYPLIEFITGLLFLLSFLKLSQESTVYSLQFTVLLLRNWLFISAIVFVFIYDLKYMLIEDVVVMPVMAVVFFLNLLAGQPFFLMLIGGLIGWLFFLVQYFLTKKKGLGEGDLRLGLFIGIMFGWPKILIVLFTSYLVGGLIAFFLLILRRKKLSSPIPLGPFLALGSLITLFFNEEIITFLSSNLTI